MCGCERAYSESRRPALDGQTVVYFPRLRMPAMCYNRRMKRVAMFFTESQRQRLRALSQKTGLSVSELVRRAVDEFLERMPK